MKLAEAITVIIWKQDSTISKNSCQYEIEQNVAYRRHRWCYCLQELPLVPLLARHTGCVIACWLEKSSFLFFLSIMCQYVHMPIPVCSHASLSMCTCLSQHAYRLSSACAHVSPSMSTVGVPYECSSFSLCVNCLAPRNITLLGKIIRLNEAKSFICLGLS